MKTKNLCAKTRKVNKPYEIWTSADGSWKWLVLKKWQVDDNKPYARWFCAVQSPFTGAHYDMGDCYVKDIKSVATCTYRDVASDVNKVCDTVKRTAPVSRDAAELRTILKLIVDAHSDTLRKPECRDTINRLRGYLLAAEQILGAQSVR